MSTFDDCCWQLSWFGHERQLMKGCRGEGWRREGGQRGGMQGWTHCRKQGDTLSHKQTMAWQEMAGRDWRHIYHVTPNWDLRNIYVTFCSINLPGTEPESWRWRLLLCGFGVCLGGYIDTRKGLIFSTAWHYIIWVAILSKFWNYILYHKEYRIICFRKSRF